MKNVIKLLGFAALVAVIGFSMIACDTGGGGGGSRKNPTPTPTPSGTRDPVTYAGTAGSYSYVLIIEDSGAARAVLTPEKDDKYTLIYGNSYVSTGTVKSINNGVLTLVPSGNKEEEFTATVSGTGITGMTGTITWDDGETEEAPATLTPLPSNSQKSIIITGISGLTGGFKGLTVCSNADGSGEVAGQMQGQITNDGLLIVNLWTPTNAPYTGSGSYYVGLGGNDWYITKEKVSITQAFTTIPWANFKEWDDGETEEITPPPSNTRDPVTYTGTADGVTYTLKIEAGGARAVLTPEEGDKYTLTVGEKTSTGTVDSFTGGKLKLVPSKDAEEPFEVTVSGNGITAMSGTITWDDGETEEAPAELAPAKSITITGISGTGAPTGNVEVMISSTQDGDDSFAGGEGTISGGSLTVALFYFDYDMEAFTGSGSYYVCIWRESDLSYWTTKEKKSITAANTTIPWANQWDKWL